LTQPISKSTTTMRLTRATITLTCILAELLPSSYSFSPFSPSLGRALRLPAKPTKWDNLVDEDENEFDNIPVPPDMTYEVRNVKRAYDSFNAIRGAGGKEATLDIYVYRGTLQIWYAPGDSEMEVAYNRPSLQMIQVPRPTIEETNALKLQVKAGLIGFQGETYTRGEEGFRTWRTDEGLPARAEINPGGESRPPTEDELEDFRRQVGSNGQSPK